MKKTTASLLVAGGLALSMGAQAASVTESFSVGPLTTELTTATATGTFNQFDAALGTLSSITIDLAYESISTTSLENTAAQEQRFSWDSNLAWQFEVLAGSGNFEDADPTLLGTTGGFVTLASGATLDLGTTTDNGTLSLTISGGDLSSYIGAGTAGIGCNTFTTSTFSGGGGNVASNQSTQASCSGDITYNFDGVTAPVPEPAAIWLIGAGLLGFAGFRAKK